MFLMSSNSAFCRDLKVSLGYIPSLSESPDQGYLVDFVRAMDEIYTEGSIIITVYPFPRSLQNVVHGLAALRYFQIVATYRY